MFCHILRDAHVLFCMNSSTRWTGPKWESGHAIQRRRGKKHWPTFGCPSLRRMLAAVGMTARRGGRGVWGGLPFLPPCLCRNISDRVAALLNFLNPTLHQSSATSAITTAGSGLNLLLRRHDGNDGERNKSLCPRGCRQRQWDCGGRKGAKHLANQVSIMPQLISSRPNQDKASKGPTLDHLRKGNPGGKCEQKWSATCLVDTLMKNRHVSVIELWRQN